MASCSEAVGQFRATFTCLPADDRDTLETLTTWAEGLCREGVVELEYSLSRGGRDRYLELAPPGQANLLHLANSSRVWVYSYAYANLGRERFLMERLGGSPPADEALGQAEALAQGKALWTTEFTPATLDGLERVLRLAAAQHR